MYNILIFLHVTSALLLGTYVIFPFFAKRLTILSGKELEGFIGLLLGFTRVGHYALIMLLLTGGGLISQLGVRPSTLWITIAITLLVIIGAIIGMINKILKQLSSADKVGDKTAENAKRINIYSWIAAVSVIAAILMMTNPSILS